MNGATLIPVVLASELVSRTNSAIAQPAAQPEPYNHVSYMMGWHSGWNGMLLGPLFMILALAVVIAVALLLVRWLSGLLRPLHPPGPPQVRSALDILKERYARGEINKEEFEERRRVIGD